MLTAIHRRAPLIALALAFVFCVAVIIGPAACRPNLPPISGCTPAAWRCSPDGRPEVCSASQRWEPAGDRSCASVGAVCVAPTDGPAHCARAQNDAAADAPDASDGGAE